MPTGFQSDIAAVAGIKAVPTILDVICATTELRFAAVVRITPDRWVTCGVRDDMGLGLQPGSERAAEATLCEAVRLGREAVIIDDVTADERYRGHPAVSVFGLQRYIAVPIVLHDGSFFGTLCALDSRPHARSDLRSGAGPFRLDKPETIETFKLFAELIAFHLSTSAKLASSEASLASSEANLASSEANLASSEATLLDERKTAELREQFIAVLGHDLRNPLSAISAGAELLKRAALDDKSSRIVGLILKSVARIAGLIDDVMDFARGRLGSGLTLDRITNEPLAPVLQQVIAELRSNFPDRAIDATIDFDGPIKCDHSRIAQLLSNLLGNALAYGSAAKPIRVKATTDGTCFALSVANSGDPIPPAALERLFQPFTRGAVRPNQQGLGLGLFIASEVARAHGGTLTVVSSPEETRFTFRMSVT